MAGEWQEFERKSSARTRNAVIAGGAVALAFIAFVHFSNGVSNQQSPVNASTQEDRTELPPTVIAPSTGGMPDTGPSRAIAAARESYVGIYECTVNGQRVISDRPCGSGAQVRTLAVDQPDPREAASAQQRQWQAQHQMHQPVTQIYAAPSTSGPSVGSDTDMSAKEAACADVDREIDQLNARMRQGYMSAAGEGLRAHWHALEDRRYALRCGR